MSGENNNPQAEPAIGRSLERARESRGLSLWQVEQETRIRSRYLRDLEREDFDVLPAVYVLGSLKTYADFLGLDGAAFSRQLKARLVEEPAEPEVSAQLAAVGGTRGEEDEYEAAPVPAVGFDQLFLGMGVILISILAVMTLVAAVAQGDESPVSQINQPATPESPSEIALAGNVQDGDDGAEDAGSSTAGNKEDRPEDGPEASKSGEESKEEGERDDQDASQASSIFGDAEFVPMSPSSTTASASAASASASPAPSSPAPSSPAPATVEPDDSPAYSAPATAGASPKPADDNPGVASAPSDTPAAAPAGPEGGGVRAPPQATAPSAGPIPAEVSRKIDEALQMNGLD